MISIKFWDCFSLHICIIYLSFDTFFMHAFCKLNCFCAKLLFKKIVPVTTNFFVAPYASHIRCLLPNHKQNKHMPDFLCVDIFIQFILYFLQNIILHMLL